MRIASRQPTEREVIARARRTQIRFAFFPVSCDDGHTYWLRRIVYELRATKKWRWGTQHPAWETLSALPYHKVRAIARLKEKP